jgi:ABC-type polysaccharide/polyol phosphate export permease
MFQAFKVMAKLLAMDLYVFRASFIDKFINTLVYCGVQLFVMGYLMRSFGLHDTYMNFFIVGLFATAGMFEIFPMVVKVMSDRIGDQSILYYCTLPTLSDLVFLRIILFSALGSLSLMVFFFPIMATVLWFQGILFDISFGPFFILLLLTALFYGSITLLLVTLVKNMTKISNIWMRFQFPLWFLGCYQFSLESLVEKTSYFGYLALLNPFTYINEGMRAVCLHGPYLHWIICAAMLTIFVLLFSYLGVTRFKKQLDVI